MADFSAIENDLFNTDDRASHASVRQRIIATAVQYGVDPALALSLAAQESEFRPGAVSDTGVKGLFQVTNETGQRYGQTPQTRSDPDVSMQTGIRHLRTLLDETGGDVRKALRRYGDPNESDYPDKVLRHYRTQARTVPDTPENRELMAGMQRSLGPYKAPQQAQQKSLDAIERELFGETPAASAPAGPGPLAPALGPQGDVTAPDTPSGTRVPLSATFPSGDVVEDMSSEAVTRTPSDLVIPIEKPSTPAPPPPSLFNYQPAERAEPGQRVPLGMDERLQEALPDPTARGLAALLLGAAGGYLPGFAAAGALTKYAPTLAPKLISGLVPAIDTAGSYATHQLSKLAGLTPGEPTFVPQDLGDMLALSPSLGLIPPAYRQAVRMSRGGRAIRAADRATAEATQVAEADFRLRASDAQARAAAKTQADREAYIQGQGEAYGQVYDDLTAQNQQTIQDLHARYQHEAAVQRAQALPERYLPAMPERTVGDVRRDIAFVEQGGRAAETVMKRIGVQTPDDAYRVLTEEGTRLMEAGQAFPPRPGEPIPSSYQRPEPRMPGMQIEEAPGIMRFIANNGRVKLTGDELASDFGTMLKGYVNNKSGKTLDQMAQAAHEAGLTASPDKVSLLDAVREATRPRQARVGYEAPPPEAPTPRPGRGQRASEVYYERLEEVAGSAPVNLAPAQEVATEMQAQLGQSIPTMAPTRLQKIVSDLVEMGDQGSVAQVHQALKDLRPLTQSRDGRTRGIAKQLVIGLQDALEQSAGLSPATANARGLMQQARGAYRQEMAVSELQDLLRRGRPALSYKNGELTLNPNALLNAFERLANDPQSLFRGSFSPEQFAQLRADIHSFAQTPARPSVKPQLDMSERLREIAGLAPPTPQEVQYVRPQTLPSGQRQFAVEPFQAPAPVEPTVRSHFAPLSLYGTAATGTGIALGQGTKTAAATVALLTVDQLSYGLARLMIRHPAYWRQIMANGGRIPPEMYGILGALAQEREEGAP